MPSWETKHHRKTRGIAPPWMFPMCADAELFFFVDDFSQDV